MLSPIDEIKYALELLELPTLITKVDLKKQYRFLSKKYHPDQGGDAKKQEQINTAYKLLTTYIEEFRYTFDEKEVANQFPGAGSCRTDSNHNIYFKDRADAAKELINTLPFELFT